MEASNRIEFTKEMRESYTILIPTMLPRHFKMIAGLMNVYGYKVELLENVGREVIDCGLKYVHNDTCYPALLVIGQFIDALNSGKYDVNKTALLFTQTGGGCRASNYIALLRKALVKAGYPQIPVISLNFNGLEKNSGFQLTLPMMIRMMYAVLYGDILMLLINQCKPREIHKGDTEALADKWTRLLTEQLSAKRLVKYKTIKNTYKEIVRSFAALEMDNVERVKVGIVGEIYVKFSPLANRNLEEHLIEEGAEPRMAGLLDFAMYFAYGGITNAKLYGKNKLAAPIFRMFYDLMRSKQRDMMNAIRDESDFHYQGDFDHVVKLAEKYVNLGVRMGEGWLLVAEMLELIETGAGNIVCAQPFGCLPNHIVGKGVMKIIKEKNPDANIIAVDYDASASEINQRNRIKLMLANAKNNARQEQTV